MKVVARRASGEKDRLPILEIDGEPGERWPPMLGALVRSMLKVAPALDLWPALPMISVSPAAKSYHFGASFPHGGGRGRRPPRIGWGVSPGGTTSTWWTASVFPDVPATTFTLTIMANAHRIASETLVSDG